MKIGLYSVKSFVIRLIVATLLGLFSGSLKINPNFSLTNLYLCLKLNLTASSIWDLLRFYLDKDNGTMPMDVPQTRPKGERAF